jgi:hypothetical protein
MNEEEIINMSDEGYTPDEIAEKLGCCRYEVIFVIQQNELAR